MANPRVAILHPSYKRLDLAVYACKDWINNAARPEEIEYIIGMDAIDPTVEAYQERFRGVQEITKLASFAIDVGPSVNAIQASNRIAKRMSPTVELIILLSDDIGAIPQWDIELFKLLEGVDNFNDPKLIWPCDGYWSYGTILVYYMANRAFYNRVGYMLCEEYSSMFSDNELMEVGRLLNAIVPAPHLTFVHRHYSRGYVPYDETYARRNNKQEFDRNHNIFVARKARNFDLKL